MSRFSPPPLPEAPKQTSKSDTAATLTRTTAGMAAPLITRLGSGVASGFASKIPVLGTAAAGLIGSGGEILAQLIENRGTDRSINWPRVAVEGGISMIPIGGELKIGKYVKDLRSASRGAAALKGAALAGAGVVGRKATDEDPNTSALDPSNYGTGDLIQVGIGAGVGSLFGKSTPKASSMGPETPSSYLDRLKLRKAEDINTEAARLEALGDAGSQQQAQTIRITAANAKRGNEKTYDAITKTREAAAAQEAKNLGAGAGKAPALPSIEDALAQGPKAVEEFALRAEALGDQGYADALRQAAVGRGVSSGTTSRAVVRTKRAAVKEAQNQAKLDEIAAKEQALLDEGYTPVESAPREAVSATTPEGTRKGFSRGLVAPQVEEDTEAAASGVTKKRTIAQKRAAAKQPAAEPFNPPKLVVEEPAAPVPPTAPPVPVAEPVKKAVIKQKRVRAKAVQKAPEVPAVATPEVPVAEAPIPTPVSPTAPIEDIKERVLVKNPMSGRPEPAPGDFATPDKTLVLQPKEGGGWIRDEITATGRKHSETGKPRPPKVAPTEPLDLNKVRADLPNIKDPLVREMAERELGTVPTPDVENPIPALTPSAPEIHTHPPAAPEDVLKEVEAFKAKVDAARASATSQAEAEAIVKQFEPEANALQLKLSLAERAASEKGSLDPVLLARIGLGAGGAAVGGAMDEEDPLRGALIGGAAGAMTPSLFQRMGQDGGGRISPLDWLGNYQRFALLSGYPNLFINTGAPLSGSMMSSAEKLISGTLRQDPGMAEAGRAGVRSLLRPSNYSLTALRGYWDEAKQLIREADQGRGDMTGGAPNRLARFLRSPADLMTTGDTGTRSMLEKGAGWTDDMAREATLTNEPRYALTKSLANIPRTGGPLARFMFPFVKTAANAIEGSAERTPVLGMFLRKATGDPTAEATIGELAARQGLGAAVGYAAYQLGAHVDPDQGKQYYLPLLITNMGGQYGPLAAAAFAAGQASQGGDLRAQLLAGGQHFFRDLPLPTTEAPYNLFRSMVNAGSGEPVNAQTDNPILQKIPSNLVPRLLTQSIQNNDERQSRFVPPQF